MGLGSIRSNGQDSNEIVIRGAAIAKWIHLRLPSCHPGFESQAHHLHFYQIKFELFHVEKTKNKQKEAGIGPFFLKKEQLDKIIQRKDSKNILLDIARYVCFCQLSAAALSFSCATSMIS